MMYNFRFQFETPTTFQIIIFLFFVRRRESRSCSDLLYINSEIVYNNHFFLIVKNETDHDEINHTHKKKTIKFIW